MGAFDELLKARGAGAKLDAGTESSNYLEGFGRSMVESATSLVGTKDTQENSKWRAENPASAFASEVLGFGVPYIGWAKVASKIPKLAKAIDGVDDAYPDAPFVAGAAKEIIRFAPFEAGRIGAAATIGEPLADALDQDFSGVGEVALRSAGDLLIGGGLGGAIGSFRSMGRRILENKSKPGIDINASLQDQYQALQKTLLDGTATDLETSQNALNRLGYQIRNKTAGKGQAYIGELDGVKPAVTKQLNRLFGTKEGRDVSRFKFTQSSQKGTLNSREEVDRMLERFDLKDKLGSMEFPRLVQANTIKGQKIISNEIKQSLDSIDGVKGIRWARDKSDGLYVMAREYRTKGGNKSWALWKTDNPSAFLPDHSKYRETMRGRFGVFGHTTRSATPLSADPNAPTAVYDAAAQMRTQPLIDYRGLDTRKGGIQALTDRFAEGVGIPKNSTSEAALGAKAFIQKHIAPAMFQFRSSPRAGHIFAAGKMVQRKAEEITERLFLGTKTEAKAGSSVLGTIYKGAASKGGLKGLIDAVWKEGDEAVAAFQKTVLGEKSIADGISEHGLSEAGQKLLKALEEVDQFQVSGKQAIQRAVGEKEFQPKANHYMLSRFWEGDHRVELRDGAKVVGYASGKQKGTAVKRAEAMAAQANAEGLPWKVGRAHLRGDVESDINLLQHLSEKDRRIFGKMTERVLLSNNGPRRLIKERKGARGFVGDYDLWTKDQVEGMIVNQLRSYQMHNGKLAFKNLYQDDLMQLAREDPHMAEIVARRTDDIFGVQGPVEKALNQASDTLISPLLGANSASKIVGATNNALFRLTFGFVNAGFNAANLLTFVQTSMPHLAFLTSAPPARAMQYYTYWPVAGAKSMDSIGTLDIMKLMSKSFKQMGSKDPDLNRMVGRAVNDGTISPRFVEEWVGQQASVGRGFREALSGKEPVSKWIGAVADALPVATEKFARGHSFVLGHTFFKEVMGVTDDEALYQLARQFTEKTQFLYSTADRAQMTSGPLGSAFGLFKNWMFHYMGWMAEYAGEGVKRGNWKPLLWQQAGTAAIGGVGGLAGYGAINSAAQWLTGDTATLRLYEAMNGTDKEPGPWADAAYYGLPAFLGVSLQNQTSSPFADPGQDAQRMFSFVYADRLKFIQKTASQAIDHYTATGENPVLDPKTRDLFMRAFAPKQVYRAAQAVNERGIQSLSSGSLVLKDAGIAERIAFGMGMDPVRLAKQYQVSGELHKNKEAVREKVQALGQAWATATLERDKAVQQRIIAEAIANGIDLSRVMKSAKARMAVGREDIIEREFSIENTISYKKAGML